MAMEVMKLIFAVLYVSLNDGPDLTECNWSVSDCSILGTVVTEGAR